MSVSKTFEDRHKTKERYMYKGIQRLVELNHLLAFLATGKSSYKEIDENKMELFALLSTK